MVLSLIIHLIYRLIFVVVSTFFFNDTATTEIYTLSLHDALPISCCCRRCTPCSPTGRSGRRWSGRGRPGCSSKCRSDEDRKSTRLNSSHTVISYAVFCLKKKNY